MGKIIDTFINGDAVAAVINPKKLGTPRNIIFKRVRRPNH